MKRYKNIVLAVLVALTLVVSVIAPRIAFADSNEISALAVDKYTREPIEGVHVVIYQGGSTIVAEGETGADGYFRPYLPLPDGAYRVEQTTYKEGYVPQVDSVSYVFQDATYGLGEVVVAELENQPILGNIIVKVVDTDGNPIAGATLKATAANVAGPRIPTPPFTQTGILTMEADGSYSLTTGADGSVVIPNLMGNTSTTITQLTTIDGYQIDTTVRVGQITGTNTTATVTFVDPRIPAPTVPDPDPTPAPEPEPTPAPEPQPQPQPETPKAKKVKKSVLPDTGDNALTLPLIIGVAGATIVVAAAALFLHKKRQ
ncbi:MAG: LPXTG cell wall anchor domain-containing protein [Atopobium sp.]|nr:LPXTG cell wall anchor domain-containing protein [Atopobium sp.]